MNKIFYFSVLGLCLCFASFGHSDEQWYPSRYGADDTIGAANNLSSEITIQAAKLVKKGKVYPLGIITNRHTPTYEPREFQMIITQSRDGTGKLKGKNVLTSNDDLLITHLGIGTQIDGFGHIGLNHRYYNGVHASEFIQAEGITKYGTENIPPIATRGVLLDMTKYFGVKQISAGKAFNKKDIEAAAKQQGIKIKKGDVVLFHTNWLAKAKEDKAEYIDTQPGLGVDGARYLAQQGVVAIGADTAALEVIPFEDKELYFPVHQELLTKNGVYILESINTAQLAQDQVSEFLFVLGQPRFAGAVQMVINPIAIY